MTQYEEMRAEAMAWDQPPVMPLSISDQLLRLVRNVKRYVQLRFF